MEQVNKTVVNGPQEIAKNMSRNIKDKAVQANVRQIITNIVRGQVYVRRTRVATAKHLLSAGEQIGSEVDWIVRRPLKPAESQTVVLDPPDRYQNKTPKQADACGHSPSGHEL